MVLWILSRGIFYKWGGAWILLLLAPFMSRQPLLCELWVSGSSLSNPWESLNVGNPLCTTLEHPTADCAGTGAVCWFTYNVTYIMFTEKKKYLKCSESHTLDCWNKLWLFSPKLTPFWHWKAEFPSYFKIPFSFIYKKNSLTSMLNLKFSRSYIITSFGFCFLWVSTGKD